jgi:hypothetical protein
VVEARSLLLIKTSKRKALRWREQEQDRHNLGQEGLEEEV